MNTFTYRNNGSLLYRYHSNFVILNDDAENFKSFVDWNNDEFVITNIEAYMGKEFEYELDCEGMCNCYVENNSNDIGRRSVGSSLVYTSRFFSVVAVSVLGFASAKFVDGHVDDCYEEARRSLGLYDDGEEDSSQFLTCSMENTKCELKNEPVMRKKKKEEAIKVFMCNGHCLDKLVTKKQYNQLNAQKALKDMNCRSRWAGEKRVIITKDDNVFVQRWKRKREDLKDTLYEHPIYNAHIVQKYKKLHLSQFCQSFISQYFYIDPDRNRRDDRMRKIQPCSSRTSAPKYNPFSHIKCRQIVEFD